MNKQPTSQEFFDKTLDHLRKQGGPAIVDGSCKYRGNQGRSCAVGCHIPPELYSPNMEGDDVLTLSEVFPEVDAYLCEDMDLVSELQAVHDGYVQSDPHTWDEYLELQMAKVATNFNLVYVKRKTDET